VNKNQFHISKNALKSPTAMLNFRNFPGVIPPDPASRSGQKDLKGDGRGKARRMEIAPAVGKF